MKNLINIEHIDKKLIKELDLKTANELSIGNYKIIMIIAIEDNNLIVDTILNAQVKEVTINKILKPNEHTRRQMSLKDKSKIIKDLITGIEYGGETVVWKSFGYEKKIINKKAKVV